MPRASSTYWVHRHREAAACSRLVAPWSTGGSSDGARVAESTSRRHASAASFTTCAVTWSSRSRCGSRWSAVSRKRRPKLRAACAITAHAVFTHFDRRSESCAASGSRSVSRIAAPKPAVWAAPPRSSAWSRRIASFRCCQPSSARSGNFRDRAISFTSRWSSASEWGTSGAGGASGCSATTPDFRREEEAAGVRAVAAGVRGEGTGILEP